MGDWLLSNSMAGAVQMEANLQERLSVLLHIRKLKCCYKRQVLTVISHVALALIVSKILKFQFFYLENVGQGDQVKLLVMVSFHSKYQIFKSCSAQFYSSSHRFRDINFKILTFKKQVTESNFCNDTIQWQMSKLTNVSHKFLCQLLPFQRYKNCKFLPSKSRFRSCSAFLLLYVR